MTKGLKLFNSSRLRLLAILAVAGSGVGLIWHVRAEPVFISEAVIRIEPKSIPVMCNPAGQTFPKRSKPEPVHQELLVSDKAIKNCLESQAKLNDLPLLSKLPTERRLQEIANNLTAEISREDSFIFNLNYRCSHPTDGTKILNAAIEIYRSTLDEEFDKTKAIDRLASKDEIHSLLNGHQGYQGHQFSIIKNAATVQKTAFEFARRILIGTALGTVAGFCILITLNSLVTARPLQSVSDA